MESFLKKHKLLGTSQRVPLAFFLLFWLLLGLNLLRGSTGIKGQDQSPQSIQVKSNQKNLPMVSRYYKDALFKRSPNYFDILLVDIPCSPDVNDKTFTWRKKLGGGTYGDAWLAVDKRSNRTVVVKKLRTINIQRLQKEMKLMENLCGGPNIIQLLDVYCDNPKRIHSSLRFVYEYIPNIYYKTLFPTLTDYDFRYYFYMIMMALDYTHEHGIIHRDLKPINVMIDHDKRELRVIDWGLSDYYVPKEEYSVRVATRMYKAPEVLYNFQTYDYSFDMWTMGVIIGSAVFNRQPLFKGKDDPDMAFRISEMLGVEEVLRFLKNYNVEVSKKNEASLMLGLKKVSWGDFITKQNSQWVSWEVLDLLDKLLVVEPSERLSAAEAMKHPYFDPVREDAEQHTVYNIEECKVWSIR